MTPNNKFATCITLLERHRLRGWVAIIREGKGFIEQSGATDNTTPVAFSISAFATESTQIELGDEIEYSLRKSSGRLVAENILKVPLTIQNFYVSITRTFVDGGKERLYSLVCSSHGSSRSNRHACSHVEQRRVRGARSCAEAHG